MKPLSFVRSASAIAGIALLSSGDAFAAGTAAGTTVSNQATVSYEAGGIAQPTVNSNNYQFVVDRKINLSAATTDGAAVSVTPGSTGNVLTFTLQNSGNGVQDFRVTAVSRSGGSGAFGGTDSVDAAGVQVFVESGATLGYQAGEDTATYVDELAADGTITVYIVGDFSSGAYANGQVATYDLLAEARAGGASSSEGAALTQTSGADTVGSVDIVFADGQGSATSSDSSRDAKFSAASDFSILAAALTVTKSSTVVSDPFNSTSNPKAIPGAVVEYTLTIANAGGAATATSVQVADSLNAEITAGNVAFAADGYASGRGIRVTAPNLNSGSAANLTNAGGDDAADWNVTATNTVTVGNIQLAGGESATVQFRVTIQ